MKKLFTLLALSLLLTTGINAQGTARVQVVHNCADAAAATVDVYLTALGASTLLFNDVPFRAAEPFIDAPAGIPLQVGIAPGNSASVNDTIANFNLTLAANTNYIVVADGIIDTPNYSPAPPFGLQIYAQAQEFASTPGKVDVLVHHGSTDAPAVDVVEVAQTGGARIVNGAAYTGFAGYLELDPIDYELQVRTDECDITVAQYTAPLGSLIPATLADSAVMVVASGFLDPAANNNGAAFGLFAVLPSGGPFIALPSSSISTSRAQVIHNAPDVLADTVDVWFNDQPLLVDFAFRTASPFIDIPAGTDFDISIQPKNSTDTIGALARFTYNVPGGDKFHLIAAGHVDPSLYSPGVPFDIHVYNLAQECAAAAGNTDISVYHGSTDAPTVDVVETAVPLGTIADDLAYSQATFYAQVPTQDLVVDVRDQTGTTTVASFQAPIATLGYEDSALVVLASGFLNTANNNGGEPFGLWVALPGGGDLIPLPVIVGVEDELAAEVDFSVFPNPAQNFLNIKYDSPVNGETTATLHDLSGRAIASQAFGNLSQGEQELQIDVLDIPAGMYLLNVQQGNIQLNQKVQIIH